MATLPENWEWDYDGQRWFYRYKPTGLTQYTFPKPGDEFPEFVDDSAPRLNLAPEEKLVSQRQLKRRTTLGSPSSRQSSSADRQRERAASDAVSDQDDGSSLIWLQPDGLMYMGPGAYNDISPVLEDEEPGRQDTKKGGTTQDAAGDPATATTQPPQSQVTPVTSAENTPLVASRQPATATAEPDSRQVPYDPIGVVAELPSELTARCHEELNPAPVELPGNDVMADAPRPLVYANAFNLDPVELPSEEVPAGRREAGDRTTEQKTPVPGAPGQERVHRSEVYRPYKPAIQNSPPSSARNSVQSSSAAAEPTPGKYQPYNPAKQAAIASLPTSRSSSVEPRDRGTASGNKRHTMAGPSGPAPSHLQPSHVPAALHPGQGISKRASNAPTNDEQGTVPAARERSEASSGGLAHVPSVLQPARGRPVRFQSPPQSQGASPSRSYRPYQPYRDLQRDIEDTVQLLSKTGYGQSTTAPPQISNSGKPQTPRTSTMPMELPALPDAGVRPQSPPPSASAPAVPRIQQSHHVFSDEASMPMSQFSAPLPTSSPDLPKPLRLPRKPAASASESNLPTVTAAQELPAATVELDVIPLAAPPVPDDTLVGSTPGAINGGPETNLDLRGCLDSKDQAEAHSDQAEPARHSSRTNTLNILQTETQKTTDEAVQVNLHVPQCPLPAAPEPTKHHGDRLDSHKVAIPSPPSISRQAPIPQSPSPVSRASSASAPRGNIPPHPPPESPPAASTTGPRASQMPPIQTSPGHARSSPQTAVLYPSPMGTSPSLPPSTAPTTSAPVPEYNLPAGHHPLSSHPVNVSQSPTPEPPSPPTLDRRPHGPVAAQSLSVASTRENSSVHVQTPPAVTAGQIPRASTLPVLSGPPVHNTFQGPAIPVHTSAQPTTSQPPHPGVSATAIPQVPVMSSPPVMPAGVPQHNVVLLQQPYAFQPAMPHPTNMAQYQPAPPETTQASQAPHRPQSMVLPQNTAPAKEEKSWFGRLWRSESTRKASSSGVRGTANKLQKLQAPASRPAPPQPSSPIQPHGGAQKASPPMFARGPPQGMMAPPPHMMANPAPPSQPVAPGFQQNAPPQPQHQQHQQQQQNLVWQSGSGGGHGSPQFQSQTQKNGQPVMPPPLVRQAIQQQALLLPAGQRCESRARA